MFSVLTFPTITMSNLIWLLFKRKAFLVFYSLYYYTTWKRNEMDDPWLDLGLEKKTQTKTPQQAIFKAMEKKLNGGFVWHDFIISH